MSRGVLDGDCQLFKGWNNLFYHTSVSHHWTCLCYLKVRTNSFNFQSLSSQKIYFHSEFEKKIFGHLLIFVSLFLAVQNTSIGDLVTDSVTDWLRVLLLLTLQSDPRDLWPLRHLIRVMKRHDLTEKRPTYQHTYPVPTYLPMYLH